MEGISKNYSVVQEQPKKGRKALKHTANAALTTAGVGAVALAHNNMQKIYDAFAGQKYWGSPITKTVENKNIFSKLKNVFGPKGSAWLKLAEGFDVLGEKIFSSNKLNALFEAHEQRWAKKPEIFAKCVKNNKAEAAIALYAVLTALGIIGAGIYKAGKINGEGK